MNLKIALDKANMELKQNGIKSSLLDSEILLSKAINQTRAFILLNLNEKIKNDNYHYYMKLIHKRKKGMPVAYLTGEKDFWKHKFIINEDVLIPRPETELIIEQALKYFRYKSNVNFLDIGVGSGCIILSILKEKEIFLAPELI